MKTLSVRFRFIVIGVIVIVAVVSCCNFPLIEDTKSYLEIGHDVRGKRTYVAWKDEGTELYRALEQVRDHKGKICLCVLMPGGTPYPHQLNNDCPNYHCHPVNITTVKVTKSKAADNIAAGESAVNDPNITHRVQSPDPKDIKAVLDALATPTPAP